MKILIGLLISFLVGAGCRFFDIPSPSPPVLPGAILVVAMTFGYTLTDRAERKGSRCDNEASLRRTQRSVCQRHRAERSPCGAVMRARTTQALNGSMIRLNSEAYWVNSRFFCSTRIDGSRVRDS
jgi:XapX domain-containing protein